MRTLVAVLVSAVALVVAYGAISMPENLDRGDQSQPTVTPQPQTGVDAPRSPGGVGVVEASAKSEAPPVDPLVESNTAAASSPDVATKPKSVFTSMDDPIPVKNGGLIEIAHLAHFVKHGPPTTGREPEGSLLSRVHQIRTHAPNIRFGLFRVAVFLNGNLQLCDAERSDRSVSFTGTGKKNSIAYSGVGREIDEVKARWGM